MPKRNGVGIALLADPTRRRIITLLAQHPWRPKMLAMELGLSFPAVSGQLALLCEAGLVRRLPTLADARGVLYFVEPDAQGRIIAWLAGTEVGCHADGSPATPQAPAPHGEAEQVPRMPGVPTGRR